MQVLNKTFFERQNTTRVARNLLGKVLVRRYRGKTSAYVITEVEAYDGPQDKASHAYRGKTARNAPMFGEAGCWYVYFVYGMYWMLNIVTGPKKYPAAILIRGAILLSDSITRTMFACAEHEVVRPAADASRSRHPTPPSAETMLGNSLRQLGCCLRKVLSTEHCARYLRTTQWSNDIDGPGKLTRALHLDKKFNGKRANKKTGLWIEDWGITIPPRAIRKVPRVGVSYAKEWAQKPYRFVANF